MRITLTITEDMRTAPWSRNAALEWMPLLALTALPIAVSPWLASWVCMWTLAGGIFAGFKWATWYRAMVAGTETSAGLSAAYLLLWPGMNAHEFLRQGESIAKPAANQWIWALAKTIFGAGLIWGVARQADQPLLAGWLGMAGILFLLHFGIFHLIALGFQTFGVNARPLMHAPILAKSVGEFWGSRWNAGFRDIAFGLAFRPLSRKLGIGRAMLFTFFLSGVVHDLVITFPAGGGYGLPTVYFMIQGCALLFERMSIARRTILRSMLTSRIFTILIVACPVALLFPPPFVLHVIIPFLQVIRAIP